MDCGDGGCGKITRRANFRLSRRANHLYKFACLTRQEGRIAIITALDSKLIFHPIGFVACTAYSVKLISQVIHETNSL
jgi:hypothetical protein